VVILDTLKTWAKPVARSLYPAGLAAFLVLSGLALCLGSALLLRKGVISPDLFLPLLIIAAGVQIFRRRRSALHLFLVYFILTWIAAVAEVGLDGWSLLPRVDYACGVLPFFYMPMMRDHLRPNRLSQWWESLPKYRWAAGPVALAVLGISVIAANAHAPAAGAIAARTPVAISGDWPSFGGGTMADKFSPLSNITPDNARNLKKLWEFVEPAPDTGKAPRKDEVTPLQIGDKVFICQPDNLVLALDAETGRQVWRYDPHTNLTGAGANICRGLAYFEDSHDRTCPRRLLMGTMDARLIAINADTGRTCDGFGKAGQVDLTAGLGDVKKGFYYVTSPPTIANGVAVIGALVRDNHEVGEPSGVVRGYDVHTGKLRWAWDMGRTQDPAKPIPAGDSYTRGTPNAWSIFSADPKLGLVYIPMGNATPDFVGQHRRPEWERYSSALVALDLATGKPRWVFQTVHHDLWDYDLSAQPVLADMPDAGQTLPAIIIATKRGDLFVLDRRSGKPITPVEERAVASTDVPGEWTSRTQPFSVAMPALGGPRLKDVDMWGVTPFDRIFCRISFQKLRYDGDFTPPSLQGSLIYPGMAGGVDWGGVSVDPGRHLLIVPTLHIADRLQLIKRTTNDTTGDNPQLGTSYSADLNYFVTRLGIPCQRPPYARLTAIDLVSRRIAWQRPLGSAERVGPLGIASHLPFTLGAPPIVGGPMTTAGDVTFIGAVGDRRLRALNSLNGHELWSTRLPAGNQATPITYRAPKSGRQIVLIVSGGWADLGQTRRVPTHIIAYAVGH
jgi:membrane-bound PQQ-dependent dehydrogenase (glucose/quinate/shikimate family)